ncbi:MULTISPECIES: DNA polymerase III subunit chi [Oceanimonas]|uniref:DNA polymerase III subunit chi n=1 Tax=Oceanimonas smirnovii TaxID=264574 RepID=A0ABW7P1X9_9GAMM|nr:DNA polymerase III subunit chi [Oceanimonas smirnovii]
MNTGCFHLLTNDDDTQLQQLVCRLATDCYRQNQGVFIYTTDQAMAEAIDERLWQQEADSFVAHNLQGEGPRQGAPVMIGWQPPANGRAVLINLATEAPAFARRFGQLHDFVPASDAGKQQARERFKAYRQAGFELTTAPVPPHTQDV